MKHLLTKTFLIVSALTLSTGTASAAKLLTLTCDVLDATTKLPRTQFSPGDPILVGFKAIGPNDGSVMATGPGTDRGAHVKLTATAKIAGIKLPFNISQSYYLVLSDTTGTQTESFAIDESRTITVPPNVPKGSTLTLTLSAIVGQVGSGTCKKAISVQ